MALRPAVDVPSANRRNELTCQSLRDNVQCTQYKCSQLMFMFLRKVSSLPPRSLFFEFGLPLEGMRESIMFFNDACLIVYGDSL